MNIYKNARAGDPGTLQKGNPAGSQSNYNSVATLPTKQEALKPFSMIRKAYLPPGIYDLECIGWNVNPPSQGLREKLVFWFKAIGTPYDEITTGRYYNVYRDKNDIQHFPSRSDYTREIGRLWPERNDIQPDDLVGETVQCEVVEQTKDRRGKKLKDGIKPTQINEIIGWPE